MKPQEIKYSCQGKRTLPIQTEGKIIPIGGKIYWHLANFTPDMDKYKVILAFEKAFALWQTYFNRFNIKFESTSDVNQSQITIHFKNNGDRDLPSPFQEGVLAYAYLAQNNKALGLEGDMFFNDLYNWGEMHSPGSIFLLKVAVHEMGHSFGLHHSEFIEDIMYPQYQPNDSVIFTPDTIEGIVDLYGPAIEPPSGGPECPEQNDARDIFKALWKDIKYHRVSRKELNAAALILGLKPKDYRRKKDIWAAILN